MKSVIPLFKRIRSRFSSTPPQNSGVASLQPSSSPKSKKSSKSKKSPAKSKTSPQKSARAPSSSTKESFKPRKHAAQKQVASKKSPRPGRHPLAKKSPAKSAQKSMEGGGGNGRRRSPRSQRRHRGGAGSCAAVVNQLSNSVPVNSWSGPFLPDTGIGAYMNTAAATGVQSTDAMASMFPHMILPQSVLLPYAGSIS